MEGGPKTVRVWRDHVAAVDQGELVSQVGFGDGYPLLVLSEESLAEGPGTCPACRARC
jgi:hypothetical protein